MIKAGELSLLLLAPLLLGACASTNNQAEIEYYENLGEITEASETERRTPCPQRAAPKINWRVVGFLWKPKAEHGPAPLVALNNGPATSGPTLYGIKRPQYGVRRHNPRRHVKISDLPLRSIGDVGYVYQANALRASTLRSQYKDLYVRIVDAKNGCVRWLLADPRRRSDGLRG